MYDQEIGRLIMPMSDYNKLFFSVVFISQFSSQTLGIYASQFDDECDGFRSAIMSLSQSLIPPTLFDPIADTLGKLQAGHDYVGVACLLADQFKASGNIDFSEQLLQAACNGFVVMALSDQAKRNLSICFLRMKSYEKSLKIAEHLAQRNPDDVQAQIFAVAILRETPDSQTRALKKITTIRSQYKLKEAEINTLLSLEKSLSEDIS